MKYYTSVDYIYSKLLTNIPNEHHHSSLFNHINEIYITLSLKFMDVIFQLLPNVLIKLLTMDECIYLNFS